MRLYAFHCLRQIHIALIKIKKNKQIVQSSSDYLHDGRYRNSLTYDSIFNTKFPPHIKNSTFSSQIENLNKIAKYIIILLNYFTRYRVINVDNKKIFEGTELVISSSHTEIKIFDFKNKQVLSLYKSVDKLIRVNEAKMRFMPSYYVPSTLDMNKGSSYIVEELIPHTDYNIESVFLLLCESLCNHLSCNNSRLTIDVQRYHDACVNFESIFGISKSIKDDIGSVMTFTHGDLWSSNIIYYKGKVYVTDFEHAAYRYFLYDFFMFMFTEWQIKNDDRLILNYFNGQYDAILLKMFNLVGLKYVENYKDNYFMAFIVSILYERWINYTAIENLIKKFINKYIS